MSRPLGYASNLEVFTMLNALSVQTTDEKALTLHEAAERLNVSYSTIFSYRKELGLSLIHI